MMNTNHHIFAGITTKPQEALMDTAAEEGCTGSSQLPFLAAELAKHGLTSRWTRKPGASNATCTGVGGDAVWLGTIETPCGVGGVDGILPLHVVEDRPEKPVPILFPLDLQEKLGCEINMQDNICRLLAYPNNDGTPNTIKIRVVEPSGHRGINVFDFEEVH